MRPQNIPVAASCALLKEVHDVPVAVPECDTLLPHRSSTPSGQTTAFNDLQIRVAIEAGPECGRRGRRLFGVGSYIHAGLTCPAQGRHRDSWHSWARAYPPIGVAT
jgi:hypothetical protein